MTDDDLIESMAAEMANRLSQRGAPFSEMSDGAKESYRDMARAALAVAKRELIERAAKIADTFAGGCYEGISEMIAREIREMADE